eukprot:jgi/Bigna1/68274/fgenesh1_pg.5_\
MGVTGILGDSKFQQLVKEIFEIAADVGVDKGLQRTLFGTRAAIRFAAEIASNPKEYIDPATSLPAAPKVLRGLFERLGATYVKLGQFIASSPTLFPEEYVLEFQKCLDKDPFNTFELIKSTIEADLGRPIDEVFSYIDPTPIASASVAQVHRGILKSSGDSVAIKVQKPLVDSVLAADLGFLLSAAKIIQYLNPGLNGVPIAGIMEDVSKLNGVSTDPTVVRNKVLWRPDEWKSSTLSRDSEGNIRLDGWVLDRKLSNNLKKVWRWENPNENKVLGCLETNDLFHNSSSFEEGSKKIIFYKIA